MDNKKVIYYNDELNDEFSEAKIIPIDVDVNYKYKHNILWDFASFIVQNFLSIPIKVLYAKLKFKNKCIGKEKLKKCKKQAYFIYANHTQPFADTFIPSNHIYPKRNFLIVNPENVSMKGMKTLVPMLGAIPIPTKLNGMPKFLDSIEDKVKRKYAITIYPEAHIWPYYTKIRPFKSVSFKYPVKYDTPVYCMTNTYQALGKTEKKKEKNRLKEKVQIVTYVDGPFYPNKELSLKEAQEDLRNRVYETMCERSKNSNIEIIEYKKKN